MAKGFSVDVQMCTIQLSPTIHCIGMVTTALIPTTVLEICSPKENPGHFRSTSIPLLVKGQLFYFNFPTIPNQS